MSSVQIQGRNAEEKVAQPFILCGIKFSDSVKLLKSEKQCIQNAGNKYSFVIRTTNYNISL